MTREQQLECIKIICKAYDLKVFIHNPDAQRISSYPDTQSISLSKLKTLANTPTIILTLHWAHHPKKIGAGVCIDDGERDMFGNLTPFICSYRSLEYLIDKLQDKQLFCQKLPKKDVFQHYDVYEPYRNAYVPNFSSPEELRLKLAIASGKQSLLEEREKQQ